MILFLTLKLLSRYKGIKSFCSQVTMIFPRYLFGSISSGQCWTAGVYDMTRVREIHHLNYISLGRSMKYLIQLLTLPKVGRHSMKKMFETWFLKIQIILRTCKFHPIWKLCLWVTPILWSVENKTEFYFVLNKNEVLNPHSEFLTYPYKIIII